jgi:hypothetical protein
MGFEEQLKEILARLPIERQTLLFSATLPKLLVPHPSLLPFQWPQPILAPNS